MKQNNMLAMILAGGRGSRLHELTNKVAKPAVSYGGRYKIIDFPLSNCANSGIDVVGVLTQYESILLNSYVAIGRRWGLDAKDSGVFVLPPREKADSNLDVYRGTADAISQNIDFIDNYGPDYLLVLSGDHIYKMNYAKMLAEHKAQNAEATIAVIEVPIREASRFGIMNTNETGQIVEFEEKPEHPKSNLASMGIYIFNWKTLRKLLVADMKDPDSNHDFGKDIIPQMLNNGNKLYAYKFKGYWKDVGTIDSLWEANMDLLDKNNELDLHDPTWKIYTEDVTSLPQYIGPDAQINQAFITQGCIIEGEVRNSVLFTGAKVGAGAKIIDSVLMPGVVVEEGAVVTRALVADNVKIGKEAVVGSADSEHIELVSKRVKGKNNMARAFGIINFAGNHIQVEGMQAYRPVGAFSFLGRYRVIDFQISNMSNSGIDHMQVYIRRKPQSLTAHLGTGRHYNINSKRGRLQILYAELGTGFTIYNNDIAAYMENMEYIEKEHYPYVIIAPSYMIYTANYKELLQNHIDSRSRYYTFISFRGYRQGIFPELLYLESEPAEGLLSIDQNHGNAKNRNIFYGYLYYEKELFIELVHKAKKTSSMYTLADIVNASCDELDIRGVSHRGYFASITDFKSYYDANISLIDFKTAQNLLMNGPFIPGPTIPVRHSILIPQM